SDRSASARQSRVCDVQGPHDAHRRRGAAARASAPQRGRRCAVARVWRTCAEAERGDPRYGSVLMKKIPPATDGGFARWLAGRAGEMLLRLREQMGFAAPDALRDAGDKLSHELIVDQMALWRPADAVLSEEGIDDPARLTADRVWIVDPLDGTREYGEP